MVIDAHLDQFPASPGYLNSATVGLPPRRALTVMQRHLDDWANGRCSSADFDGYVNRARAAYGQLVGTDVGSVGIVSCVSAVSGLVATNLPDEANVLCAEEDFTSVLFPFLVDDRLKVETVPLEQLVDRIGPTTDLVAVSAVQSADGRVLDLEALVEAASTHGARTYVDVTQAAGWLPVDVARFDVTACGAYKWLCAPRGTGFITTGSDDDWLKPRWAGWYSTEHPWESIYGPPLRIAGDARRYNFSPPWFDMAAAAESIELLVDVGLDAIRDHVVGLTNDFRDRVDLPAANSSIVAVETDRGSELEAAGVKAATRAGKVRLAFHVYNTSDDVELAAATLG